MTWWTTWYHWLKFNLNYFPVQTDWSSPGNWPGRGCFLESPASNSIVLMGSHSFLKTPSLSLWHSRSLCLKNLSLALFWSLSFLMHTDKVSRSFCQIVHFTVQRWYRWKDYFWALGICWYFGTALNWALMSFQDWFWYFSVKSMTF
jgi:hypothetical protein